MTIDSLRRVFMTGMSRVEYRAVTWNFDILRQIVWPRGTGAVLGPLVSAASVVSLIHYGFGLRLDSILVIFLNSYDRIVGLVLSWLEPSLKALLSWVAYRLDWDFVLYRHWRHVFVLLNLYFLGGARADFKDNSPVAWFRLCLGLSLGFAISVVVGVVPLAQKDLTTQFLVAFIPFFATSLNDIALRAWRATFSRVRESVRVKQPAMTWWQYFRPAFVGVLNRTVVAIVFILVGLRFPIVSELQSPGLALLGVLVLALAVQQLYLGLGDAKRIREEGETNLAAWMRSRGTLIGLRIFSVAFWVAFFLAVYVGEQLYQHS